MGQKMASEAISDRLIQENFSGRASPQPPQILRTYCICIYFGHAIFKQLAMALQRLYLCVLIYIYGCIIIKVRLTYRIHWLISAYAYFQSCKEICAYYPIWANNEGTKIDHTPKPQPFFGSACTVHDRRVESQRSSILYCCNSLAMKPLVKS